MSTLSPIRRWILCGAALFLLALELAASIPDHASQRWHALLRSPVLPLEPRRAAGSGASLDRNFDLYVAYVRRETPPGSKLLLLLGPDPGRRASPAWYWHRSNFLLAPSLVYSLDVLRENPTRVTYVALYGQGPLPPGVKRIRDLPGGRIGSAP